MTNTHTRSFIWDVITHSFPNTIEIWKWKSNYIPLFMQINYLSMR